MRKRKDLTCKKAVAMLSRKEEKRLGQTSRFELWKHLEECVLCKRFAEQQKLVIEAFPKQPVVSLTEEEKQELISMMKVAESSG